MENSFYCSSQLELVMGIRTAGTTPGPATALRIAMRGATAVVLTLSRESGVDTKFLEARESKTSL